LTPSTDASRLRHHPGIGHRRELREPHAVRKVIHRLGCALQRQAGLAEAAGAHQRHEAPLGERTPKLGERALATDERGHLLRQVVRRRGERAQGGKLVSQRRMHDLEYALGTRQIAQADGAQVLQRDGGRKPLGEQYRERLRGQHLAAVSRRHDPRRAVQYAPEEIVVPPLGDAGVEAAASVQHDAVRRSGIGEGHSETRARRQSHPWDRRTRRTCRRPSS
jgi:hypothetical protein